MMKQPGHWISSDTSENEPAVCAIATLSLFEQARHRIHYWHLNDDDAMYLELVTLVDLREEL